MKGKTYEVHLRYDFEGFNAMLEWVEWYEVLENRWRNGIKKINLSRALP